MKYVNNLTRYQFLDKIYNYELNPNDWIYLGNMPSMVVFHTENDKFCKELKPGLEILAKKNRGKYYVYSVDTVEEPDMATIFNIGKIPTIYLCPLKGDPTIFRDTISIKELSEKAKKILLPEY
jgi:Thioredoxin domain-containing protein